AHAAYYASHGPAWAATASREAAMRQRLALEMDNLVAAHEFVRSRAHSVAQSTQWLQLLVAMEPVVLARGPLDPYDGWLDDALAASEGAPSALRARALTSRARAERFAGRLDGAVALFEGA